MNRSSLLGCVCASFLIAACGDDGGTGDGGGTDTDPTGATMSTSTTMSTSAGPTTDPTDDGPSTGESTSDTDTDSGSATDPDTGTASDTGEPAELVAYRLDQIEVRDPHFIAFGLDVTASQVNGPLTAALSEDGDEDGFLDLGFVLLFRPLDQADGSSNDFEFANAQCTAPVESAACDLFPDSTAYATAYNSDTVGPCLAADPANLSVYDSPPPPPEPTEAPCFNTDAIDVVIETGSFGLTLSDAVVAAQYVGDPATGLVGGNIEGFLSLADAEATEVVTDFGTFTIASLLQAEDMDGDGWRMHMSFTAVPVDWTGE